MAYYRPRGFRGHMASASLKRTRLKDEVWADLEIPRPYGLGLIEAMDDQEGVNCAI